MTCIYYLTYLEKDIPFYIGKTINTYSRLFSHKKTYGKNIKLVKIIEVDNKDWLFWEKYYINLYKSQGYALLNKNKGGGGSTKASEEKIKKLKKIKCKPILQYDLEGNFIKEWSSAKEFANEKGLKNGGCIVRNLKNKNCSSYGYVWKYKQNENYPLKINSIKKNWKTKAILQYDLQGNFIKEWSSILEAAKVLNMKQQNICNNLNNRAKTAHNYKWKYKK